MLAAIVPAAGACPVCFGGPDSISKGMDTAILFLLSIVGLVQVGFVALFWSFRRRAKALQRKREQFHLIEGGLR
jgi:heme/copper-type cytochrome/quinol oxidase subunit 2